MVFLLPGRVAIGTHAKEQIMSEMEMEGNWQASSPNAHFSVSLCSLHSLQKSKKRNYLMFGLMGKERGEKR